MNPLLWYSQADWVKIPPAANITYVSVLAYVCLCHWWLWLGKCLASGNFLCLVQQCNWTLPYSPIKVKKKMKEAVLQWIDNDTDKTFVTYTICCVENLNECVLAIMVYLMIVMWDHIEICHISCRRRPRRSLAGSRFMVMCLGHPRWACFCLSSSDRALRSSSWPSSPFVSASGTEMN